MLALTTVSSVAAPERVGDFALLDEQGGFHQLSRYQHRAAVVLLAYDSNCTAARDAAAMLAGLQSRFAERIEFLALDINAMDRASVHDWQLSFPVLADELKLVAQGLQISQAGEVLVFNPQRLSLYYRGGADQALQENLNAILSGNTSAPSGSEVRGCPIPYDSNAATAPDYSTEVAPIIVEHCSICHREDGAGPFAFNGYYSLVGWSAMVKEVIMNKRMPPMQIDPAYAATPNAHFLSAEKRRKILHWMQAGAPRGEGAEDPLAEVPLEKPFDWQLGVPDFVIDTPTNVIPAVGILDYMYTELELPFTEDKWVRAFQFDPGEERVIHNLSAFIVPTESDFWDEERNTLTSERRFLGSFIPGENPATVFPEGTGVLIPAGHKLALQFHYYSHGRVLEDTTTIGLYFHDAAPAREIVTRPVSARFTLSPTDHDQALHASYAFDEKATLLAVRPRMNQRGKHMKFDLVPPDGETETLVSVPAYNYGWQPQYWLETPRTLEPGTVVKVSGAFDNSLSNPFNPNFREGVEWGFDSGEEMFTGYLTYAVDRQGIK
ncbi:MAG: redoxin domain-containing protein [Gammaproteobacteria bacterium]|nr:redoxin domain-containing protein [Gammaproteobacteria bacterium]MDP2347084.1 redoxin domain-containing protein [Gammaproteobacteria bacterium]